MRMKTRYETSASPSIPCRNMGHFAIFVGGGIMRSCKSTNLDATQANVYAGPFEVEVFTGILLLVGE